MATVTIKKKTVDAPTFEKKMLGLLKMVKGMDIPEPNKGILLDEIRHIHITCLEWEESEQKDALEVPDFMQNKVYTLGKETLV